MDSVLFDKIPQDEGIQQRMYIDALPIAPLSENAPVEFVVPGSGAQYIDLKETQLYVKCSLRMGNGSAIPGIPDDDQSPKEDAYVSVTHNLLNSLWKQVDVFMGDKLISTSGQNYPYKSYIDVLLNKGMDAKKTNFEIKCSLRIRPIIWMMRM